MSDGLLEGSSSTIVSRAIHSTFVLAEERVGEAIHVVVRLATVAEQLLSEVEPLLVARHAVVRGELEVGVLVLCTRHLCTPVIVAWGSFPSLGHHVGLVV